MYGISSGIMDKEIVSIQEDKPVVVEDKAGKLDKILYNEKNARLVMDAIVISIMDREPGWQKLAIAVLDKLYPSVKSGSISYKSANVTNVVNDKNLYKNIVNTTREGIMEKVRAINDRKPSI